jgi:hypothetical protein
MPQSGQEIRCGDFRTLRYVITRTGIAGDWTKGDNYHQFRATNGAVLNYWKSTGTINFQGPESAAAELKTTILQRALVIRR